MIKSFRFIVLLTFLLPALALAQNATLAGRVTDNSGGVVPGVTVTVTDSGTGRSQTSVTNENGQYRLGARQDYATGTMGLFFPSILIVE